MQSVLQEVQGGFCSDQGHSFVCNFEVGFKSSALELDVCLAMLCLVNVGNVHLKEKSFAEG